MKKLLLDGEWAVSGGGYSDIKAEVPGCIHTDLMANNIISDPYFRDNEFSQMWVGETDWVYERVFHASPELLREKNVRLVCRGLDTVCEIAVNGEKIGKADNMFRTWEFDVKSALREGANSIIVKFESALKYARKKNAERWLWTSGLNNERLEGSNRVRKMQCNFGWDWGPKCVTCGIWKDIFIEAESSPRIADIKVTQSHDGGSVRLGITAALRDYDGQKLSAKASVSLKGEWIASVPLEIGSGSASEEIMIKEPRLWWPNNMGGQPLYDVIFDLIGENGEMLDKKEKRIGLRTLILDRHEDEWGESFRFCANGEPFFAKGANWIPIDTFVTRADADFYRQLLAAAKKANMNMIRVWGGGIYEADVFYDICDELGLCVWQDFMFACSAYPAYDADFMENVKMEAGENIKRLRHHPCMALFCGNNEIEHDQKGCINDKGDGGTMTWAEYKTLFDVLLKDAAAENAPDICYWPSSSHTPAGSRQEPNDPASGDAHLWQVWHGRQPFEWYRTCRHRFISEFGFQSFPEPEAVKGFTLPEDRNISSFIMEHHQRSLIGNDAVMQYMLSWFMLPKDFDMLLMLSQILQGTAIKYAVEHWRRNIPQTMGALYWQLNDCWPAASWSSIDYLGNWKALHFMAKRFFAPVLISGVEDRESLNVEIHISNDTLEEKSGKVVWKLMNLNGKLEEKGDFEAVIAANSSEKAKTLNLSAAVKRAGGTREAILFYSFVVAGIEAVSNTTYFERPKHIRLQEPKYEVGIKLVNTNEYEATIRADKPALWVWLELEGVSAKYSDRFFNLDGEEGKKITIITDEAVGVGELKKKISVYSVVDTYK